jgi:uncharacterized SAM-binding protein YcdF (DUF218 family)
MIFKKIGALVLAGIVLLAGYYISKPTSDPKRSNSQYSVKITGIDVKMHAGIKLIEDRKWGEANDYFRKLALEYPDEYLPLWYMAMTSSSYNHYHKAISALSSSIKRKPESKEAQFVLGLYLAAWEDNHTGKSTTGELESHLSALDMTMPDLSKQLRKVISEIRDRLDGSVSSELSGSFGEETVLITLGWPLDANDNIQGPLLRRLIKTNDLATKHKHTSIILTGGNPKSYGSSEAEKMIEWLVDRGIKRERMIKESRALDTVGNAKESLKIVEKKEFKKIVIITDEFHIPRAVHLFELFKEQSLRADVSIFSVSAEAQQQRGRSSSAKERFSIYRDTARALGYWMPY